METAKIYKARICYTFGMGPCYENITAYNYTDIKDAVTRRVSVLAHSTAYSLGQHNPVHVQTVTYYYPSGKKYTERIER